MDMIDAIIYVGLIVYIIYAIITWKKRIKQLKSYFSKKKK